ncbi:cupin domain-containing protein [Zavarzinia sp. CC-PAN008]|uniref:cupin domain-containing protein n=1 Tax=Zavarzinia sp. CC-PAN008 TaxID=3243332 RepID=UPI003F743A76
MTERRITPIHDTPLAVYDLDGEVQRDIGWVPLNYDRARMEGSFLMRMSPGSSSLPHVHPGHEQFLILEGELIDDDGTVFRAGDFVSFAPSTRHSSRTETGCLIIVWEWRPDRAVSD